MRRCLLIGVIVCNVFQNTFAYLLEQYGCSKLMCEFCRIVRRSNPSRDSSILGGLLFSTFRLPACLLSRNLRGVVELSDWHSFVAVRDRGLVRLSSLLVSCRRRSASIHMGGGLRAQRLDISMNKSWRLFGLHLSHGSNC